MADVSVNVGVTGISEFKKSMSDAQASIKSIDAALKLNEKQLEATGKAEEALTSNTELLNQKLKKQQEVAQSAENALKQMRDNGVGTSSKAYQDMQRKLLEAQAAIIDTEKDIESIGKKSVEASGQTDQLADSLGGIGKKVSLEQVISGVEKVTGKLEAGARAAINFGKKFARSAMDTTAWADDILTRSVEYGVDAETLQKMEYVADLIDTDVDTIISAKDRLAKSRGSLAELLGITTEGKSAEDLFWEAGEAIMKMDDSLDKSEISMKIFGRNWRELIPLFTAGQEEYNALLAKQSVLSNEQVKSLGEADDAFKDIEHQVEQLKAEFWAENSDTIVELLKWIVDNKESVKTALEVIAGGFGLLKVGEFALEITKIVDGLKTLGIIKGTTAAAGAAGATGTGAAGMLGTAVTTVGPIAAVLGLALTPAMLVQGQAQKQWSSDFERRMAAADLGGANAWFIRAAAEALGANGQTDFGSTYNLLMGLSSRQNQQKAELYNTLRGSTTAGNNTWNLLNRFWEGEALDPGVVDELLQDITDAFAASDEKVKVAMEPKMDDNAAEEIAKQVGTVPITMDPVLSPIFRALRGGGYANGLPYVPNDGFYFLHQGETVTPARERTSRTLNSNMYIEKMIMNNGQDADGLADRVATKNQRMMNSYGS